MTISNGQFWFGLFMGTTGFIIGFWQTITGVTYGRYRRGGRIYRTDDPRGFWIQVIATWVLAALLIVVATFFRPFTVTLPGRADLFIMAVIFLGFMVVMWLGRRN